MLLSLATHPLFSTGEFTGVDSVGGVLSYTSTYDLTNAGIYEPGFTMADLLPLSDRVFDLHGGIVPLTSNPTDGITGLPGTFDVNLPVGAGKVVLVSAVPEPATLTIVGMGLVGLGFLRQRRAA